MARAAVATLVFTSAVLLGGCEREMRRFETPESSQGSVDAVRLSSLQPGPAPGGAPTPTSEPGPAGPAGANAVDPPAPTSRHEENAYAVSQGKRLFRWYNCNGCHASGGGDIGPPLMDDKWIYGHEPANIFATIVQGRPNGMPAFRGRIPDEQVWQIVAYVRSMSGQVRQDVAPGRSDALSTGEPEAMREREQPSSASVPPSAVQSE